MSSPADWKARIAAATVQLSKLGGQGVLVPGGFVLTATHCIEWSGTGGMALGDHYSEPVTTSGGASFRLSPVALDAVADIAVLAAPDNQQFSDDCEAFEEWCDATAAVSLSRAFEDWCRKVAAPGARLGFPVQCLTHTAEWVSGEAMRISQGAPFQAAILPVDFSAPVRGGTSGGAIVDDHGELVGIVSHTNEVMEGPCDGMQPVASYALPRWVLECITEASS